MYDDPFVMAGQGTIGLKIMEQLTDIELVFVPIGRGGLISGIATGWLVVAHAANIDMVGVPNSLQREFLRAAYKPLKLDKINSKNRKVLDILSEMYNLHKTILETERNHCI